MSNYGQLCWLPRVTWSERVRLSVAVLLRRRGLTALRR